jgi:hypothetical protein
LVVGLRLTLIGAAFMNTYRIDGFAISGPDFLGFGSLLFIKPWW